MTLHKSANTQWLGQAALSLNVHKCRKNYSNLLLHNVNGYLRIKQNEQIVLGSCENILMKIVIFTTRVRPENVSRFLQIIRPRDSTKAKKKFEKNLDMTK